jgi:hypothetical protein
MSLLSEDQLKETVARISIDLQRLENHFAKAGIPGNKQLKFRFPRGRLRTAKKFRNDYWFIRDVNLKCNVSYTLILTDVYCWILNRTDLYGAAQAMLIKEGVCLVGALAESITKDAMQDHCGRHTSFKKRTVKMVELGIITADLQTSLDALWDWRNREHLYLLGDLEYDKYSLAHYNSAILTLRAMRDAIGTWKKAQDTSY